MQNGRHYKKRCGIRRTFFNFRFLHIPGYPPAGIPKYYKLYLLLHKRQVCFGIVKKSVVVKLTKFFQCLRCKTFLLQCAIYHRRISAWVRCINSHSIVISKHISKNDCLYCIPFHFVSRDPIEKFLFQSCKKAFHSGIIITVIHSAQALFHSRVG